MNSVSVVAETDAKFYPNPEFISTVDSTARKQWHDALINCQHEQTRGRMVWANQNTRKVCCLMVGHEAFGGDNRTRGRGAPLGNSPFTMAMERHTNPYITIKETCPITGAKKKVRVTAAGCNDDYRLTFKQIAKLVYPEAYIE